MVSDSSDLQDRLSPLSNTNAEIVSMVHEISERWDSLPTDAQSKIVAALRRTLAELETLERFAESIQQSQQSRKKD